MLKLKNNLILLFVIVIGIAINSCGVDSTTETSGTSFSGYTIGVSAIYGETSLIANGSSKATVKVEVWDSASGTTVNNASVTLTATLGTLASSSLTTVNGTAVTTFTAGTTAGNASVTATVENVSASVVISLARF